VWKRATRPLAFDVAHVERTLLSATFDFDCDFDFDCGFDFDFASDFDFACDSFTVNGTG
jgi:hypothetical protein